MLMGFMPLKAEVATETSLAMPTLSQLTSEVSSTLLDHVVLTHIFSKGSNKML